MQAMHPQVNSVSDSIDSPGPDPTHEGKFGTLEPPSGEVSVDLAERVAAALTASARAEAALRAMFRTVKFLGASVGAARETNEALVQELRTLHALLGERSVPAGERMTAKALEARADLLEQALGDAAEQAVRDREFLISEHDSFIATLVDDHEKEVANLRRRVSEAESRLAAREARDFDFGWDDESKA